MPHIKLTEGVPGIRSLAIFRPETGQYLYELAQVLLRGDSPLPEADRELIAAYVSYRNACAFCMESHAAAARCLYGTSAGTVDEVLHDMENSPVTAKMKALLHIAGQVQILGSAVTEADVAAARAAGANDREIHDTVLIAAVFCMYNRYVDGLATFTPSDDKVYAAMGQRLAEHGYVTPNPQS